MTIQHLRSSTANKRPTPAAMSDGQIAVNTNTASPGLFFKDSAGALIKVGPVHVGTTAPNASPAGGGETGNTVGEQWLDTAGGTYVFKVWDGSAWRSESGTFVDVNGDVMTGALGIIAGSAGSPGLYFSGDTNTGLYSPGADQVAISTGGSGRLFVDASGNVGINTASPQGQLSLGSAEADFRGLTLDWTGGGGPFPVACFTVERNTAEIRIGGVRTNFFPTFYSNNQERLRITAAGLVGVGTSSPSKRLTIVQDGADSALRIEQSGEGYNFYRNQANGFLYLEGSQQTFSGFGFRVTPTGGSTTNAVWIDNSGRVGVGTTSPTYLCNVLAASGSQNIFQAGQTGVSNGYTITSNGTNLTHAWFNGGSEAVRIDSSGRLGIGTSAPVTRLHVQSGLDGDGIAIAHQNAPSGGQGPSLAFRHSTNNGTQQNFAYIKSLMAGGGDTTWDSHLVFGTGGYQMQERMRITNAGNVGIGTTSPGATLDVNGNIRISSAVGLEIASSSNSTITHKSGGSSTAYYTYLDASRNYIWQDNATERMRIDSSGRLLVGTSSSVNTFGVAPVFQVAGGEAYQSNIAYRADAFAPFISVGHSRSATVGSQTVLQSGDDFGTFAFVGSDGATFIQGAHIKAQVDGTPGTNDMPGRLVFSTTADGASSPTERMRLTNAGNLNVFSSDVIYARSSAAAGFGNYLYSGWHSATGTTNGTLSFAVYTNGNVQNTNNAYGSLSDIKLKENIVDANSQWSDLKALQVRNYNFKEGETHTQIGLVAQEVELVSPGLVSESPDRDAEGNDLGTVTKSVNYSVLYMKAVKALQEAMERIETLEAKVAALESA